MIFQFDKSILEEDRKEVIKTLIFHHEQNYKSRIKKLKRYYEGKHDAIVSKKSDKFKPNNRVINPFPALIVNTVQGYLLGQPVKYISENKELLEQVLDIYYSAEDLEPNGFIAPRTLKAKIRNDKTAALNYVVEDKVSGEPARMHGEAIVYTKHFDRSKAELIAGDFDKVYVGILDEIEYKVSEEGTVGDINLFEQDMVAIRATMRVGFLVIKPEAFGVLKPVVAKATRSK